MDKAKKKRIKRYLTWGCMALVVLGLTVMPLLAQSEAEADGPQASILSAQAELGSISAALHGGGTLQAQGAQEVNIPSGVKITEFLVKNGETVTEGQPLASVDKVSVMTAITQVHESMEFLRQELEKARDESVSNTIPATAGGRVKLVYAQPGERVQDVMLRDGCLAVLSLDGLMAVRLNVSSDAATGETVQVVLSDGSAVSGRVESNLSGVVTVTIEDEGYAPGEKVTVEGMGSGVLFIHNAWRATAYTGTVSRVHVQPERTVTAGAALFTLTDTDYAGQLQRRANQHREYEQLLQRLLTMYQTGTIDAPCDGVVSGVDRDSAHLLGAASGAGSYTITFLSNVTYPCSGDQACQAEPEEHEEDCPMVCTESSACPARKHTKDCIKSCTHGDAPENCPATVHYDDCILRCTQSETCPSSKHTLTCIHSCTHADSLGQCPAAVHYGDCISGCTGDGACKSQKHRFDCVSRCSLSTAAGEECPARNHKEGCYYADVTYTAMAAKVDGVAAQDGKLLVYLDVTSRYTAQRADTPSGWELTPELNRGLFLYQTELPVADPGGYQAGDIILLVTGVKASGEELPRQVVHYEEAGDGQGNQGGQGGFPGTGGGFDWGSLMGGVPSMGGSFGGLGSYGGYDGTLNQTPDEGLYDLEGSALLTVTPSSAMVLNITLDERDIAKVQPGMAAEVKVEALRGQSYGAVVSKIASSGANSGGSSKFTVELTLDAAADMIPGMSATARLPLETREQILTVPAAALTSRGGRCMVYTALDSDSGEPCNAVEVLTGLSDGHQVEILSGLEPGAVVYYSYYDTLELDTSAEAERFTFR